MAIQLLAIEEIRKGVPLEIHLVVTNLIFQSQINGFSRWCY